MKTLAQGTPQAFTGTVAKVLVVAFGAVLALLIATKVTEAKMQHLKREQASLEPSKVTAAIRERELKCLAQNIYYEAGYEPFEGKVAVAQVTMNRSESGKFPKDICGVVYQKTALYGSTICQFSWYCETPKNTGNPPVNSDAYKESMEVAKKVLLEGFRLDGLKEALYFHADYVKGNWGKQKLAQIGRHIFYAEPKNVALN
jgi:spore germination cell wall hydrolase CwlJ-like protein